VSIELNKHIEQKTKKAPRIPSPHVALDPGVNLCATCKLKIKEAKKSKKVKDNLQIELGLESGRVAQVPVVASHVCVVQNLHGLCFGKASRN